MLRRLKTSTVLHRYAIPVDQELMSAFQEQRTERSFRVNTVVVLPTIVRRFVKYRFRVSDVGNCVYKARGPP